MCGIVGYTGFEDCVDHIVEGLKKLEYRGYDSSGIAVITGKDIEIRKSTGKIKVLEKKIVENPVSGNTGIGHTRWATHGKPSNDNAHPHLSKSLALVHNGIIENFASLKTQLIKEGFEFVSETDTEVIAHLISFELNKKKEIEEAIFEAVKRLEGAFAVALITPLRPEEIFVMKNASPLVFGITDKSGMVASDIPALLHETNKVLVLDEKEVGVVGRGRFAIYDFSGNRKDRKLFMINLDPVSVEKGGHKHFMHKEIFEQPTALINTMEQRLDLEKGRVFLEELSKTQHPDRIVITACGTSYHAGLIGKYLIEGLSGISTEVYLASEFRYQDPILKEKDCFLCISQSGETADTIEALKESKKKGARIISITNVPQSTIDRLSDITLYTYAGPEIGVASTKAFLTQVLVLVMMSIYFSKKDRSDLIHELAKLPGKIGLVLKQEEEIQKIAKILSRYKNFLYLGRGINYPVALEGALKMKEITYIHAEGYAAGEMKHGPIALIDENMPSVVIATSNFLIKKMIANIEEIKARDGIVISIVNEDCKEVIERSDFSIVVPEVDYFLEPIINSVPLQLLAYHVADFLGTDVDQPRNLAKSVTVE